MLLQLSDGFSYHTKGASSVSPSGIAITSFPKTVEDTGDSLKLDTPDSLQPAAYTQYGLNLSKIMSSLRSKVSILFSSFYNLDKKQTKHFCTYRGCVNKVRI